MIIDKEIENTKFCTKCGVQLEDYNWQKSWGKNSRYMCRTCSSKYRTKLYNTTKYRLYRYKYSIKRTKKVWSLTDNQTIEMFLSPCYLCGKEAKDNVYLNGIDRIDTKKGYTLNNCKSCCDKCNMGRHMSGTQRDLTPDEYIAHCKRVIEYQEKIKLTQKGEKNEIIK